MSTTVRRTGSAPPERWRAALAAVWQDERTPRIGFAVATVGALALLMYLGRSLTFYHDEWSFILERRDLTLDDLVRPHDEHWSTLLVLWYVALFSVFGLSSYLPYLAALLVLHVVVAWGIFRLVEREAGGWAALALAGLMLFLGAGHENLFWAFQAGFVGATAAGTWSLIALREGRRRHAVPLAAVLLTVAVATQSIGLFFVVACAALICADRSWRSRWPAVAVPTSVYLAWFLLAGRGAISQHRDPFTAEAVASVPAYVVRGLEWSVGSVTGWGPDVGRILAVLAVAAILWMVLRGRRPPDLVVAAGAGVLAQYALTGLVRAQLGVDQATESRYTYVAAAILLPGLGAALGTWVGRALTWRHAALLPLLAMALLVNGYALLAGKSTFQERANFTRAYVEVAATHASARSVAESHGVEPYPAPAELLRLAAQHGSPLTDRWLPSVVHEATAELRDQALTGMLVDAVSVEPRASDAPASGTLEVVTAEHVTWTMDGPACIALDARGTLPSITIRVGGADDLALRAGAGGVVSVGLGLEVRPQAPILTAPVEAAVAYVVALPDLEPGAHWMVRLDLPAARGPTTICGAHARG